MVEKVIEARLREATPEEVQMQKGSLAWRIVTYPCTLVNKVLNTWEIFRKGPNILEWEIPAPIALAHQIQWLLGYKPEWAFMYDRNLFIGTIHTVEKESKILETFFGNHRNEGFFKCSRSMELLFKIAGDIFPETKFSKEDFILTCSSPKTKKYKNLILHKLVGPNKLDPKPIIQEEARELLINWNKRSETEEINASMDIRAFTSRILTRLLLGNSQHAQELSEAINFINYYIVKAVTKQVTVKDKESYLTVLKTFNAAVNSVLSSKEIPLFEDSIDLTLAEKQAMIFMLFFAGQETTASLISYGLWLLGNNSDLAIQLVNIDENSIHNFFKLCIHDFPPAYGVSRSLAKNLCLEYKLEGDSDYKRKIMLENDFLSVYIMDRHEKQYSYSNQDRFYFGGGPHKCPGETLAKNEFIEFFKIFINEYHVTRVEPQELKKIGFFTLKCSDIFLRIQSF